MKNLLSHLVQLWKEKHDKSAAASSPDQETYYDLIDASIRQNDLHFDVYGNAW